VLSGPGITAWYLTLNTRKPPFSDVRVRQALNYAINKDAMIKAIYYGYAVPSQGPVPEAVQFGVNVGTYPYDLAKARKLLAEANYPNGFSTELWGGNNSTAQKAMAFLQQQLLQVGIKTRITPLEPGQRVELLENAQKPDEAGVRMFWGGNNSTAQKAMAFLQQQLLQVGIKTRITPLEPGQRVELLENAQKPDEAGVRMFWGGWSSSTGEADWAIRPLLATSSQPPKGLQNFSYYSNPRVDTLLQKALATTKVKEKAAMYKEAQQIIFKDAPWVFLVNTQVVYARTKNLTGVCVMPDGSLNFDDVAFK